MKSRAWLWSIAIVLCAMVALSSQLNAQNNPQHHPRHHQYKLYDVGTFGGPNAWGSGDAISLTPAGLVGTADTPATDPFCFYDCYVMHGFLWRNGHLTDLGTLPGNHGGNSSGAFAINNSGLIVGTSENGRTDLATGYPSTSPVAWLNGHIFNLGGFGGTQGVAYMVNNRGQIVGIANNTTPDDFAISPWGPFPSTTQAHAFVWENGWMRDLGTLGGPDTLAGLISDSGYVAGQSLISFTPTCPDSTGIPTPEPFLWDGRRMIDLGNFGGTCGGWPTWVNNKGQVVGLSYIPDNSKVHAFLWDHGRLTDIGTSTAVASGAYWINEAGTITGFNYAPGPGNAGAALWKHGTITILGILPGYDCASEGYSVNDADQVVGSGYPCDDSPLHGFLWEDGDLVDLNDLIQPPADITVTHTWLIDNRGNILTDGVDADGNNHAVVLVPNGYCDWLCEQRIEQSRNNPHTAQPATTGTTKPRFGKPADWLRNPFRPRWGLMTSRAVPAN